MSRQPQRSLGAKCRFLTAKPTKKTPLSEGAATIRSKTGATPQKPPPPMTSANADWANPPDVTVEVTPQMKMNNSILAVLLMGFVGGVWYYSMTAVGSQEKNSEDPLAQLKLEAQEAMDRQEKELRPEGKTKQLLQEFSRGDHDPDRAEVDALEELEKLEEEEAASKKKKWYKFW